MPRKPRFNLSGIPQHVIQRGNNRDPCFFAEEDYTAILNICRKLLRNMIVGFMHMYSRQTMLPLLRIPAPAALLSP